MTTKKTNLPPRHGGYRVATQPSTGTYKSTSSGHSVSRPPQPPQGRGGGSQPTAKAS